MIVEEYVQNALVTESADKAPILNRMDHQYRLVHIALGLSSELSELVSMLTSGQVDDINLAEELGDIFWYCAISVDVLGVGSGEVFSFATDAERSRRLSTLQRGSPILPRLIYDLTIYVGELSDLVKKHVFYGKLIDVEHYVNSLACIVHTSEHILHVFGITAQDAMDRNIAKLRSRYGEKFTEAKALERNLDLERTILEGRN